MSRNLKVYIQLYKRNVLNFALYVLVTISLYLLSYCFLCFSLSLSLLKQIKRGNVISTAVLNISHSADNKYISTTIFKLSVEMFVKYVVLCALKIVFIQ